MRSTCGRQVLSFDTEIEWFAGEHCSPCGKAGDYSTQRRRNSRKNSDNS